MFAHVAAGMGACKIIKEEDSGLIISEYADVLPPDYRVASKAGAEFLVEVKNFHKADATTPFTLKEPYLRRLQKYSQLFDLELKIAIYWSGWRRWTLLPASAFTISTGKAQVTFAEAVQRSEMAKLGDYEIGTKAPLTAKFVSDPAKPRGIDGDGNAMPTIRSVELYCGGVQIAKPLEKRIAWFLMLTGEWQSVEQPAEVEDGELISWEIQAAPSNPTPDQDFALIGPLSMLISNMFTLMTAPDGMVDRLVPETEPGLLSVQIPHDYEGDALPLWRLQIKPHYP